MNLNLEHEAQHPIVIPRDHQITSLQDWSSEHHSNMKQWSSVNTGRIKVTVVGPKRHRAEDALHWVRDNNPAYADIVIDEASLYDLPAEG